MYVRIRAYLRYLEPEGGKPSALYQNPGTINPSEKTTSLRSDPPPARPGMGPGARGPGPTGGAGGADGGCRHIRQAIDTLDKL